MIPYITQATRGPFFPWRSLFRKDSPDLDLLHIVAKTSDGTCSAEVFVYSYDSMLSLRRVLGGVWNGSTEMGKGNCRKLEGWGGGV